MLVHAYKIISRLSTRKRKLPYVAHVAITNLTARNLGDDRFAVDESQSAGSPGYTMSSPQTTEDFYGILEADPSADDATIKANYKRLARLKHPDKRPGDPNATANFQKVCCCPPM
jgi:hypothetical protein